MRYALNANTATVSEQSYAISGDIVIPSSIEYKNKTYNVISIVESAFYQCWNLTGVTINNGLVSIGEYAFHDCRSLKTAIISDSVTSIGLNAFIGNSNLTIYCEAESQPSGWHDYWNDDYTVVWGYKG